MSRVPGYDYSARHAYEAPEVPRDYEAERFSGVLGSYRYRREQRAVGSLLQRIPEGIRILDCPCGTGRWWPLLAQRAESIVAVDVSESMLDFARSRIEVVGIPVEVLSSAAEQLPFSDDSFDYVFSHALTKHLPVPVQYEVLREFARVARKGVICSFGVMSHLTYEIWRRRALAESYPVLPEELAWMAEAAGLRVEAKRKCTTPLGVEHSVLFSSVDTPPPGARG
jgi:ubiquinone/menaquinone biosynthesis C-methylase UbiE